MVQQEGANLRAAGIEDLKVVIAEERLINEELRYNFGQLLKEVADIKQIMQKLILSSAKIYDKLIGNNIIGHNSRSKFLSETAFTLSPCSLPPVSQIVQGD